MTQKIGKPRSGPEHLPGGVCCESSRTQGVPVIPAEQGKRHGKEDDQELMITDDVDEADQKTDRIKDRQQRAFAVAFDFFFDGGEEECASQQDHKKKQGAG